MSRSRSSAFAAASDFTKVSALGVEEQRVNVIIDLVGPTSARESVGDNFRVDCRIIIWQSDEALRVPTSALYRVGDRWAVFAVRNGVARGTPVEIGHNNGQYAEVTAGLDPGAVVIVHPSNEIAEGVRLDVR